MKLPKEYKLVTIPFHKLKQMQQYKHYVRLHLGCDFPLLGLSDLRYKIDTN